MESYSMWSLVNGFLHLAFLQGTSMLLYVSVLFFLLFNKMLLCGYLIFCLLLCQLMDIYIVSTFCLVWLMLLWILMDMFSCGHMFSFLLDRQLKIELLGHMVILRLTSEKLPVFHTTAPCYTPISNVGGFQFVHALTNTCHHSLFWSQPS